MRIQYFRIRSEKEHVLTYTKLFSQPVLRLWYVHAWHRNGI